ncbi:aldo/keto reductase [Nitratidesulfovibrio sp.]|uniref:aldo/keto reductase n=1 Tax=Nitratidesulfovibrio sp. TaxID=2802297 RepID=UPI00333ED411
MQKKKVDGENKAAKQKERAPGVSRRTLLKAAGAGVTGGAVLYSLDKLRLLPSFEALLPEPPTDRMTCRVHPGSGDKVSLLGFGCMRFPMLPDASGPSGTEIDEAVAFGLVDYALAHGVNYFDTAYTYHRGMSEVMIGKALKRHPRERFYLATKMPGRLNPTLAQAKEMFETQLGRCQVEYFDYYLLHNLQSVDNYKKVYEEEKVLDYLLEQKKQGRIRNLGWSFHGDKEMLEYILSRPVQWDFAQVQLNYHDLLHKYDPPPNIARFVSKNPAPIQWTYEKMLASGLPLVVMEPLLGGRLARLNKKALAVLQAERPQATGASWALRYAAGLPNVLSVLSGMTYMEHLQDNLRTFAPLEPLSEQELLVLKKALDVFLTQSNIRCTTCGYCMPCPYGVDIPAVFAHYNRCLDDEQVPKGQRDPEYERARRAFLVEYGRAVPELRQAARCTGCNKCVEHCPQMIPIPEEMARLGKFVENLRIRQG